MGQKSVSGLALHTPVRSQPLQQQQTQQPQFQAPSSILKREREIPTQQSANLEDPSPAMKKPRPALSKLSINVTNPAMINPSIQKLNATINSTPIHNNSMQQIGGVSQTPGKSVPMTPSMQIYSDFSNDTENLTGFMQQK